MSFADDVDGFIGAKGGVLKVLDENDDHKIEQLVIEAEAHKPWERDPFLQAIGCLIHRRVSEAVKEWSREIVLEVPEQLRDNPAYDLIAADRGSGYE